MTVALRVAAATVTVYDKCLLANRVLGVTLKRPVDTETIVHAAPCCRNHVVYDTDVSARWCDNIEQFAFC